MHCRTNYRDTAQTRLVYLKEPDSRIQTQFDSFLRANLSPGKPRPLPNGLMMHHLHRIIGGWQAANGRK